mmetsp:Transcript_2980/g.5384  ORF Transcript_2980/g.5384 Transcript_2980/m.5384 type:complete len:235 (-) Transcript_2980:54-758(-)
MDATKLPELWILRVVSLIVLVVLFQVCIARVPTIGHETKRRWQHALTGHALVQISYLLTRSTAIALLLMASIGMFVWKVFFFENFQQAFGPLLRTKEINGEQFLPGAFYFLLGTAVTLVIVGGNQDDDGVDNDQGWVIARYAVECLALADPVASWIGSKVPSPKINAGTSVSGCLACFATAWCVGFFMLSQELKDSYTLTVGAIACTIAEGLPFGNDNMNIPILTALAVDKLGR